MKNLLSRRRFNSLGLGALVIAGTALLSCTSALAQSAGAAKAPEKVKCNVALSIYAGWMPWYLASDSGILQKWGDRYGVEFNVQKCVDYPTSLNVYAAGTADVLVVTNMDVLTLGTPSTAIIMGDYSNGNDAVISRDGKGWKDMLGNPVTLVENSVSHYLLFRGAELNGIDPNKIETKNTSDASIGSGFLNTKSQLFTATWNPIVLQIKQAPGTSVIFDSSKIPGEIQDLLVVNSAYLDKNPNAAKALAGAWYETLGLMKGRTTEAKAAIAAMAKEAGNTVDEFNSQLTTTYMYWTPNDALVFTNGAEIKGYNQSVRTFLGKRELLGKDADGKPLKADDVGIKYADGTVQGAKDNILLTYDTTYMTMARDGKLKELPAQVIPAAPAAAPSGK
jgi:NitT/TauT family transport system substrate-binding protein